MRITGDASSPAVHDAPHRLGHLGRVVVLEDGATHGQTGTSAGHHIGRFGNQAVVVVPPRTTEEEDGASDRPHHPVHGCRPRFPGPSSGTGTLRMGAPMSWAMMAAKTMVSVSRAM